MKTLFALEIEMPNGLYEFIFKDIGNGHFSLTNQLYGILIGLRKFPSGWEVGRTVPNGIELTKQALKDIGEKIDDSLVH